MRSLQNVTARLTHVLAPDFVPACPPDIRRELVQLLCVLGETKTSGVRAYVKLNRRIDPTNAVIRVGERRLAEWFEVHRRAQAWLDGGPSGGLV